ncbi:glycosyltransferase [Nitrospirota bacterium]
MRKAIIVVPCYDEGKRLPIDAMKSFMSSNSDIHFCFVNDGSRDNTLDLIKELSNDYREQAFYLDLPINYGKAEAVRRGILNCIEKHKAELIGYWDADLSTPLWQIDNFLSVFEKNPECVYVSGCRLNRLGANIKRNPIRHYTGRIFATLVSQVVSLPVYDSQCGAKIIRSDTAKAIFNKPFISRWAFDVELIARLKVILRDDILNNTVIELPLEEWRNVKGSKIRFTHCIQSLLDLLQIRIHYR